MVNDNAPLGGKLSGDYPRICGEHLDGNGASVDELGSPPLARGTRNIPIDSSFCPGITPAHAGNTHKQHKIFEAHRDHLRSRGEHAAKGRPIGLAWGSPA